MWFPKKGKRERSNMSSNLNIILLYSSCPSQLSMYLSKLQISTYLEITMKTRRLVNNAPTPEKKQEIEIVNTTTQRKTNFKRRERIDSRKTFESNTSISSYDNLPRLNSTPEKFGLESFPKKIFCFSIARL